MLEFKLMLQMFAEPPVTPPATTEPQGEQPQAVVFTAEGVDKWLSTEEGKKFIQPKLDQYATKGIQTHLEKNKDKYVSKDEYEKLKQEALERENELNGTIKKTTIQSKFQEQLLQEGANPQKLNLIMKLADMGKLSLEDNGNLMGATDLLGQLKTDAAEWFGTPPKTGTGRDEIPTGNKPPATVKTENTDFNKMMRAAGYNT